MTSTESRRVRIYDADHRMPPVKPYLAETFAHLTFAYEKSRLDLKAAHKDTWFGRLWNVLNPMLLGAVYWLLVDVIFNRGGDEPLKILAQILGGLFLFQLPAASLNLGAKSIVGGGTFVLNTRIPRLILPIGSTISAFLMFAPSIIVYTGIHLIAGLPVTLKIFWMIPIIFLLTVVALGLAMILATLNVYFRDVASLLPYVNRIWLYLTPIIYLYTFFPERHRWLILINPLGGLFTSVQMVLIEGRNPSPQYILSGAAWSFTMLFAGGYLFLRRERDFAIRI